MTENSTEKSSQTPIYLSHTLSMAAKKFCWLHKIPLQMVVVESSAPFHRLLQIINPKFADIPGDALVRKPHPTIGPQLESSQPHVSRLEIAKVETSFQIYILRENCWLASNDVRRAFDEFCRF